nr:hypothetical protein [Helicobacter pylori]
MDIYYKNRHNKGHEQQEERPYFVIYENKDFFLVFPQTTKNKKGKKYLSHKNHIINEENEIKQKYKNNCFWRCYQTQSTQ